jgi:hypothetical protein
MDATEFFEQFQDHLGPMLDTYEQTLYLYCVRHSRLLGEPEAVIGFKSAREAMASGIGKAGAPMSERVCYAKLRTLEAKGCLERLGTEHRGTRVRVFLPSEINGVVPEPAPPEAQVLEETDFFGPPANRLRILEREGHRCFYCCRAISRESYVIEHVVSRPAGDNSYRNVVASCRQCNNRKGSIDVEDFIRTLYRDGLLSQQEFAERTEQLRRLRAGELQPTHLA